MPRTKSRQKARLMRKEPTQDRSAATVEAILRAAAHILEHEGYEHASTNRIAEVAGVSIGSLYQYFPSKEAIVHRLIDRHFDEMRTLVFKETASVAALPLAEAVPRFMRTLVAAQTLDRRFHRALVEQVPRLAGLGRLREFDRETAAMLTAFFAARAHDLADTDPSLAAWMVLHAVRGITLGLLVLDPQGFDDDTVARELSRLVLLYLGPEKRAPAPEPSPGL